MLCQAWKLILSLVSELEISFCNTIALVTCLFVGFFPYILLWSSSFSIPQKTSTMERKDRGGKRQALGYGYRFVPKQTIGQETVVAWFCSYFVSCPLSFSVVLLFSFL